MLYVNHGHQLTYQYWSSNLTLPFLECGLLFEASSANFIKKQTYFSDCHRDNVFQ